MTSSANRFGGDAVRGRADALEHQLPRVGLAGLGMMGRNHARVLAQLDSAQFVAACDTDHDNTHAKAHGRPVVESIEALLEVGIDLCVLALPTSFHLRAGLQLAEAGVATLIEKPLAFSAVDCKQLIEAFARSGTPACVGHIERFNPAILELRRRLLEGEGGELHQISTRRVGPRPSRVKDLGVVKDLATHDLDLAMFLADSDYATVAAQATTLTGSLHEDLVVISGRLRSGAVANHVVNWVTPQKERNVAAVCEYGTWVANTLTGDLTWSARASEVSDWPAVNTMRGPVEGEVTRYGLPKREPLRVELEHFVALAVGEESASVSLADGLRAVAAAEAVLESSSLGETVRF